VAVVVVVVVVVVVDVDGSVLCVGLAQKKAKPNLEAVLFLKEEKKWKHVLFLPMEREPHWFAYQNILIYTTIYISLTRMPIFTLRATGSIFIEPPLCSITP
jgi:hypothetical protein